MSNGAEQPSLRGHFTLVVIGGSLGGREALQQVLAALPPRFPLPVAVVLHRGKDSCGTLAAIIQASSPLPVEEVWDKQPLDPGRVYLAPADYHLLIEKAESPIAGSAQLGERRSALSLALSSDDPGDVARPSIDALFESAADACGSGVIGVILTGYGTDGAKGLARIKRRRGLALVQDPATAQAAALPKAALLETKTDQVLRLEEIGPFLANLAAHR